MDLRAVVASAGDAGFAVPAFGASLAYLDGIRRRRSPANLLQGMRDYFGAHTYERTDRDGVFHTERSIWHRELLEAVACGIHVIGASSMGALRAAELEPFFNSGAIGLTPARVSRFSPI